jgi:hypothetical protein
MKKFKFLVLFFMLSVVSLCQVTPEAFMSMLPAIPSNQCEDNKENRDEFFARIDTVSFLIDEEIAKRNDDSDAESEVIEDQMMKNLANKYGLSQEELQSLQNDENLSEEEQAKLINKVMKKKDDISLKEVKNLDSLDENGLNSWAEALGDQKKAEIQYDPEKNQEQQLQYKNRYELGLLRKNLADSLQKVDSVFIQKFIEIDEDSVRKIMFDNILKLSEEVNSLMNGGTKEEIGVAVKKLNAEMDKYCNIFTPKYLKVLRKYESYIKSSLPACYRLEKIVAKHSSLQTGVQVKNNPGYIGIKKVREYLKKLSEAYKYNLKKTSLIVNYE